MRRRKSRSVAIDGQSLLCRGGGCAGLETLLECVERLEHLRAQRIVDRLFLAQSLQHAAVVRFDKGKQLLLEPPRFRNREIVEILVSAREDNQHLLFDW